LKSEKEEENKINSLCLRDKKLGQKESIKKLFKKWRI
jgi:hypothetical protein